MCSDVHLQWLKKVQFSLTTDWFLPEFNMSLLSFAKLAFLRFGPLPVNMLRLVVMLGFGVVSLHGHLSRFLLSLLHLSVSFFDWDEPCGLYFH